MKAPVISARPQPVAACRFTIRLVGCEPPVWRRMQAPHDAPLDWIHGVLQVAMGWTNSHLHQFRLGSFLYSDTRYHHAEFIDDPEIFEERRFTLAQLAPRKLDVVHYEYDFGDSWEHILTLEEIIYSKEAPMQPAVCLEGEGACPPEDCGGICGYAQLQQAVRNRRHPDHKSLKAWAGPGFDPARFDLATINASLAQLKWPRVTDTQLRKILMDRDTSAK